jgi:hypothetical protein
MSLSRPTIGGTRNQPLWVALAFIVLVGLIFVVTMQRMNSTDDFLKVWAAVGPIVGVVTGLIPTYFFHSSAQDASSRAEANAADAARMRGLMQGHGIDAEINSDGMAPAGD